MTKVALVDDHVLLRNGLAAVIAGFGDFEVIFEADNGKHFIQQVEIHGLPDVVLLDITMPEMDGFETAKWIRRHHPQVKVLVLSMMDNDAAIIRMLRNGAQGYILKDSKPGVLSAALHEVANRGFYMNELITGKLVHLAIKSDEDEGEMKLSDKEVAFLRLCCTEKSYKEIADEMGITPRAVEGLRSNMFEKLEIASRVGLVLYAIRNSLVTV
ncbi:response regulator transcription factor [Filimonas effusa]|uniref:Response regulator transcription factor n=1 Tax=Filimonas effusa TaxID=2508721 RepID=A0A4Q1D6Q6_9BACT|nr:response regulator transcription factor [Filimonas effusa]RXK83573.1 response regulator transcription factor [Filimonas effusa]